MERGVHCVSYNGLFNEFSKHFIKPLQLNFVDNLSIVNPKFTPLILYIGHSDNRPLKDGALPGGGMRGTPPTDENFLNSP